MQTSGRRALTVLVLAASVLGAGCRSGGSGREDGLPAASTPSGKKAATPPPVSFSPASGQADVALDAPVHVSVAAGRLTSVELTGAAGQPPIAGQLDPSGSGWSTA
ncbi:MAG: Ig-like domain-containing protein, partial [Acidimicrobiales bacterium]